MAVVWMRGIGQALVMGVGAASLTLLTGAEFGVLSDRSLAKLGSAHAESSRADHLPWGQASELSAREVEGSAANGEVDGGAPVPLASGQGRAAEEPGGSDEPPLSASGPGSRRTFFKRLDSFQFPSEDELLRDLGLSRSTAFDKAFATLRESMSGSYGARYRIKKRCKEELDRDEQAGLLGQQPTLENLGCYYLRWERLTQDFAKRVKLREQEDSERIDGPQGDQRLVRASRSVPRRMKSQKDWERLAGMSYRSAVGYFRPSGPRDALRLAKLALFDTEPCATAEARSGLMRSMEDFLPDPEIFETMAALYVHQKSCLRPTSDSFEEIHFRMGLLFLERGRLEDAGTSFSFALEDMAGRDAYRVLFWRGMLEAFRGAHHDARWPGAEKRTLGLGERIDLDSNPYWKRLITEYPLSFHALVADSVTGYSMHRKVMQQSMPWVGIFQGAEWDAHNAGAFLYALFIARREQRLMKAFGHRVIQDLDPVSFEQGLFFGLAQQEAGFTRGAIKSMFVAANRHGAGRFNLTVLDLLYPRMYVKELEKHGSNVDLAFALALMRQESSFNPQAVSAARAKGLMQVLPGTARAMMRKSQVNLLDPVQNIKAGTRYLAHLLRRYDDNYVHTIASYNAGPGKIARWKERYVTPDALLFADLIPYRETRNYVSGLLRNIHWYRVLLNGDQHEELISSSDAVTWSARSLVPDPAQWGIDSRTLPKSLVFEPVPDFRRSVPQ